MKKKNLKKKARRIERDVKNTLDFLYETSFDIYHDYSSVYETAAQTIYMKTALNYLIKLFQQKGKNLKASYDPFSITVKSSEELVEEDFIDITYSDCLSNEFFRLLTEFGWDYIPIPISDDKYTNLIDTKFHPFPGEAAFLSEMHQCFSDDYSNGMFFRLYNRRLESLNNYLFQHPEYRRCEIIRIIHDTATLVGIPFLWYFDNHTKKFPQEISDKQNSQVIYSCYYSFLGYDNMFETEVGQYCMNPFSLLYADWLNDLLDLAQQQYLFENDNGGVLKN